MDHRNEKIDDIAQGISTGEWCTEILCQEKRKKWIRQNRGLCWCNISRTWKQYKKYKERVITAISNSNINRFNLRINRKKQMKKKQLKNKYQIDNSCRDSTWLSFLLRCSTRPYKWGTHESRTRSWKFASQAC